MKDDNVLDLVSAQLADAVHRASKAIVQVHARGWRPTSGTICARDLVLIADHTLEREEELTVRTHDARKHDAELVGRDPSTDLALLRVADLGAEPPLVASELPSVGHLALAVGRSWGGTLTATAGIVSAVGGLQTGRRTRVQQIIRTDAQPYPGFSGGALINARGEILGVLTAGLLRGLALAIPSTIAWPVADTLKLHGRIKRGYLGIGSQPVHIPAAQRAGQSNDRGLLVIGVVDDAPAERAGVLLGDIVVSFDGRAVRDPEDLLALLTVDRIGKTATLEILRAGTTKTLEVMIEERPRA